jgi:hypothetical protein
MLFLPNELLDSIFAQFSTSSGSNSRQDAGTLSHICLASRRLHDVAQPLLYRSIQIDVRSDQPQLLLATLKTRPKLATAIKELYLECVATCAATYGPTRVELGYRLRQFLEDVLPMLTELRLLGSHHRVCTTKLIESVLYKAGSGYYMSTPTDLNNLQSLELFAGDYVFKYHFILRLPQLRRVCLNSVDITDESAEDEELPNDWGWPSPSPIKELVLRLSLRELGNPPQTLRSNSLQALSRSMPHLESLRIENCGTILDPWILRSLTAYFASQLNGPLRRLELIDGRINTHYPTLTDTVNFDDPTVIDKIQASKLEDLSVDWHTLFIAPVYYHQHVAYPLTTLRHITLRYVEVDALALPHQSPQLLLEHVQRRFPSLKKIDIELRIRKPVDYKVLQTYTAAFRSAGIDFNILEHPPIAPRTSARRIGSITSCGRPSTLSP